MHKPTWLRAPAKTPEASARAGVRKAVVEMQPGIDTYVTVTEADDYVAAHYGASNSARARWEGMETEDKERNLTAACLEMERLPYRGRKADGNQALSFPRLPMQYGRPLEPPWDVCAAQVELALYLSDDAAQEASQRRRDLQAQGVTAYSIDDLSETYGNPGSAGADNAVNLCPAAARLLSRYTDGGYAMC